MVRKTSKLKKIGWFTATLGSSALAWVGQLTLYDMTTWRKDITRIFFSSRTAEYMFPTLGIDMRVIHYFLIGLTLVFFGLVVLLRTRRCPHNFGYWANQPKKDSIPTKCLACKKVVECVSGTPRKQETSTKPVAENEKDFPKCAHHLGYLRSLPDSEAVPIECTPCQNLLECRNLI
jgi:hypothetical protein